MAALDLPPQLPSSSSGMRRKRKKRKKRLPRNSSLPRLRGGYMGSYCDSGGSCSTCCVVCLHRVPQSLVSGSTRHPARDRSDDDGTAQLHRYPCFWTACNSLSGSSATMVSQMFWQRLGSYCDSGGFLLYLSCRDGILENCHCFQAATWHTARDESCRRHRQFMFTAACAGDDAFPAVLGHGVVFQQQVSWSRQCRTPSH